MGAWRRVKDTEQALDESMRRAIQMARLQLHLERKSKDAKEAALEREHKVNAAKHAERSGRMKGE